MLEEEAQWLARRILELNLAPGSHVVDVGSSTDHFRQVVQPYIDHLIFGPLRERDVHITHVDAKTQPGVDLVVDLTAGQVPDVVRASGDLVLCCSLLEHVLDRRQAIENLAVITKPEGKVIVTVPHRFPYHQDPIDTGYRPSPEELADEIGDFFQVESAELIEASWGYVKSLDGTNRTLAYRFLRTLMARAGFRQMPRTCLVSGLVGRRSPNTPAQESDGLREQAK
jgi:SAM-dependent methyltransferase